MKKLNTVLTLLCISLICLYFIACNQAKNDTVDFEQFSKNLAEAINTHNVQKVVDLYADDAVIYQPDLLEPMRDKSEFEQLYAAYFRAFPDLKFEIVALIPEGNLVCMEFRETGSFSGPMATPEGDIPATNKKFEIKGASIFKVNEQGKIVEDRSYFDQATLLRQIGLQ